MNLQRRRESELGTTTATKKGEKGEDLDPRTMESGTIIVYDNLDKLRNGWKSMKGRSCVIYRKWINPLAEQENPQNNVIRASQLPIDFQLSMVKWHVHLSLQTQTSTGKIGPVNYRF